MERALHDLAEAAAQVEAAISGQSLAKVVYADSGWTAKDILAHLAAWNDEAAQSLEAYAHGGAHTVPPDREGDTYNDRAYARFADRPGEEILAWWRSTHSRLAEVAERLTGVGRSGPLTYPWGAQGDIAALLQDMVGHEREHLEPMREAFARR